MNHYTYLIKHNDSEMKYIGVRSCECNPEDDNYWGSSKYLPENVQDVCEKIILKLFKTREEAMQHEIDLHKKYNVAINKEYWNKANATSIGFNTLGTTFKQAPEAVEKMKKSISERWQNNPTFGMTGMKHTKNTKQKMSKARKGIKKSQEWKLKIGLSQKGVPKAKNTKCPYCSKVGDIANMTRWHFNNCKYKGDY